MPTVEEGVAREPEWGPEAAIGVVEPIPVFEVVGEQQEARRDDDSRGDRGPQDARRGKQQHGADAEPDAVVVQDVCRPDGQEGRAEHEQGFAEGLTCIDCHKGIAHQLPDMSQVDPSANLEVH